MRSTLLIRARLTGQGILRQSVVLLQQNKDKNPLFSANVYAVGSTQARSTNLRKDSNPVVPPPTSTSKANLPPDLSQQEKDVVDVATILRRMKYNRYPKSIDGLQVLSADLSQLSFMQWCRRNVGLILLWQVGLQVAMWMMVFLGFRLGLISSVSELRAWFVRQVGGEDKLIPPLLEPLDAASGSSIVPPINKPAESFSTASKLWKQQGSRAALCFLFAPNFYEYYYPDAAALNASKFLPKSFLKGYVVLPITHETASQLATAFGVSSAFSSVQFLIVLTPFAIIPGWRNLSRLWVQRPRFSVEQMVAIRRGGKVCATPKW